MSIGMAVAGAWASCLNWSVGTQGPTGHNYLGAGYLATVSCKLISTENTETTFGFWKERIHWMIHDFWNAPQAGEKSSRPSFVWPDNGTMIWWISSRMINDNLLICISDVWILFLAGYMFVIVVCVYTLYAYLYIIYIYVCYIYLYIIIYVCMYTYTHI